MNPTPNQFYVMNEADLGNFIKSIQYMEIPKRGYLFRWGLIKNIRTLKQNSALHLYFEHLANALNDAGLSIHMEFLGKSLEVPWDRDLVKERIWKTAMETMSNKKSTTELERKEVGEIYEVLNRHFSENHGLHVPFPERNFG